MSDGLAAERLQTFVERIERLAEEKAALGQDISAVFSEAKSTGFDPKTMRQLIRLRTMSESDRLEHEALLDIYKALLGMLKDEDLSEAARRRLSGLDKQDDEQTEGEEPAATEAAPADEGCSLDEAREQGAAAAEAGAAVTANPFPAGDKRRGAWDEGWCQASGSDGMDIPEAWRRSKPKRKKRKDKDEAP